jgi:Tol biopolymer transport system component
LCFARSFDISPDSPQVAFTWNATGNWDIHVVPIAGGTPRRLTPGLGDKYYPRWSRDGERIAYLFDPDGSEDFDVYVVPEEGGEPVALVQWPGVVERFFRWSPGGAQVAFESNEDGNFPMGAPRADACHAQARGTELCPTHRAAWA